MVSFSGFQNVTSIRGFPILDKPLIVNFVRLENLEKIIGGLQAEANTNLKDFAGLEKLDSITGQAFIYNNPGMSPLNDLEHLKFIGTFLILTSSPLLIECDAADICDYLAASNGNIFLGFNATGCSSQAEIEAPLCFLPARKYLERSCQ